jgi:hypothetical protein
MKIRRNDRLASVPPANRAQVNSWIADHPRPTVMQFVAAPLPAGVGLKSGLHPFPVAINSLWLDPATT